MVLLGRFLRRAKARSLAKVRARANSKTTEAMTQVTGEVAREATVTAVKEEVASNAETRSLVVLTPATGLARTSQLAEIVEVEASEETAVAVASAIGMVAIDHLGVNENQITVLPAPTITGALGWVAVAVVTVIETAIAGTVTGVALAVAVMMEIEMAVASAAVATVAALVETEIVELETTTTTPTGETAQLGKIIATAIAAPMRPGSGPN